MKSTTLIIGTVAAIALGWAPIAAAQDPGERVIVAAIQERGYMGVQIAFEDGALVVSGVLPGTPAEEAGLQAGDRILRIGDLATGDQEQVEAFLTGTTVGQVLALHVERGDKHANMRIRLVSLASVQPEAEEQLPPVRRVTAVDRPVIVVEHRAESESGSETGSDAAADRLQSSRVQALTKLRADARLQTEARRAEARSAEAAQERERRTQSTRLRSTARADSTQKQDDAAERRAALRERADERKARADARREEVAARKRAENRAAVAEAGTEKKDVARESAEDRQLEELKRELEGVRAELQRLREQIRKLSRERDDER